MKNSIKTELWKVFHSFPFWLSLFIGSLTVMSNVSHNAQVAAELEASNIAAAKLLGYKHGVTGYALISHWIAVSTDSVGSRYFYLIWPILAALPYGWSYCQEMRSGLSNQYMLRSGRSAYMVSKYTAVFISGGLAVSFPVVVDLIANAMILPDCLPKVLLSAIYNRGAFAELFYSYPWLYALIWITADFIFGGAAAGLCFLVGKSIRFQVMVTLFPFALLFLWNALTEVLEVPIFSLICLDMATPRMLASRPALMIQLSLMVLFSMAAAFGRGNKYDLV